jgi:Tol biopolymer transport system component
VNADGTGRTGFVTALGMNPAWSPDGTRIAFAGNVGYTSLQIYIMNADGTAQTRVTTSGLADDQPTWSPDGTKIAFERNTGGGGLRVFVINVGGSGETDITNSNVGGDRAPDWQNAAGQGVPGPPGPPGPVAGEFPIVPQG